MIIQLDKLPVGAKFLYDGVEYRKTNGFHDGRVFCVNSNYNVGGFNNNTNVEAICEGFDHRDIVTDGEKKYVYISIEDTNLFVCEDLTILENPNKDFIKC